MMILYAWYEKSWNKTNDWSLMSYDVFCVFIILNHKSTLHNENDDDDHGMRKEEGWIKNIHEIKEINESSIDGA